MNCLNYPFNLLAEADNLFKTAALASLLLPTFPKQYFFDLRKLRQSDDSHQKFQCSATSSVHPECEGGEILELLMRAYGLSSLHQSTSIVFPINE